MNSNYILDFTIPQGPTGPTGPAGTSDNFVKSFGYLYNQAQINSIFLPNNQLIQVTLPLKQLKENVFYPSDNTIGFLNEGAYVVSYSILLQIPSASTANVVTVTTKLRLNDITSEDTSVKMTIKNDLPYYFANTVIINRNVNDYIDLVISADNQTDFNYTSAFICAIKISNLAQP